MNGAFRLLALLPVLWSTAVPSQSTAALPLGEVKVAGTRRLTAADVTRMSGLAPGKPVSGPDIDAAAKRLTNSGLLKRVSFQYAAEGGRWVVTFQIEDLEWTAPVIVDNFIWFSDDEVTRALGDAIPSFAGMIPDTAEASALASSALLRLLASKQIPGRVDVLPEGDLRQMKGLLFKVIDPAPKVCSWQFVGASAIPSSELEAEMTAGGPNYSRTFVTRASKGTLTNLYRRRAHWRATVDPPVTTLSQTPACTGAIVSVSIHEGAEYRWAGAQWIGNAAIASRELETLLGVKNGEPADLRKIEDGIRRIEGAYGKVGYVTQRATLTERLDDAAALATFEIRIQEGPQFRLGTVEYVGLAATDADALSKRWRIKTGDVYDASYPAQFATDEIRPRLPRGAKPPTTQTRINTQQRTVDVQFVFAK